MLKIFSPLICFLNVDLSVNVEFSVCLYCLLFFYFAFFQMMLNGISIRLYNQNKPIIYITNSLPRLMIELSFCLLNIPCKL